MIATQARDAHVDIPGQFFFLSFIFYVTNIFTSNLRDEEDDDSNARGGSRHVELLKKEYNR
jgi:hypothetical protein